MSNKKILKVTTCVDVDTNTEAIDFAFTREELNIKKQFI